MWAEAKSSRASFCDGLGFAEPVFSISYSKNGPGQRDGLTSLGLVESTQFIWRQVLETLPELVFCSQKMHEVFRKLR